MMTDKYLPTESAVKLMCPCISCFIHTGDRKQIQDLNWQRKNDQLAAGAKLRELESKYVV